MEKKKEVHIAERVSDLKVKAGKKYGISPDECHIGHLILEAMLEKPDVIAQIDCATGKSETNLSVATRSARIASSMKNYGLKPGDTVVVMGFNHLDVAIPYYASHIGGHSMCSMDPGIPQVDIDALFGTVEPKMVFCQKDNVEKVRAAYNTNNMDGHIVTFDDMEKFIEKHNGSEIDYRPPVINDKEVPAWLVLTSGTTGRPKVAIVPYKTLLNAIIKWWAPFPEYFEKTLAMATIQWLSSLIYFISTPLRCFTRLQSSVPLSPPLLISLINKYRPNATAWTPFLLGQFLEVGSDCDLSCFKYILIAGAAIEKKLVDRFREKCNAYLYLVYGMTELMVPIFDFVPETPFRSAGLPFDIYEYRLVTDDGSTITEPNTNGELWIRGDAFFKGYLNNPEETQKFLTEDGWLKTGDIFYRDEKNFYYMVERKRLLIRYLGLWVAPAEIEEVIRRHPGIADVCVVGIPNDPTIELAVAAVVKRNGKTVTAQDIFDHVKAELPELKQLHGGLFFVESLPQLVAGKINRAEVVKMALTAKRIMP